MNNFIRSHVLLALLIIVSVFSGLVFGIRAARGGSPDDQNSPTPDSPPHNGPPPKGPPPKGPPGVERAIDALNLTDDQKQQVDPLVQEFRRQQEQARNEFLEKMKAIVSAEQYQQLESAIMRPPPPPQPRPADSADPADAPSSQPSAQANPDSSNLAASVSANFTGNLPVSITGGHDTDPRDRGRPVVLVAAGLNVPSDVFRKAFSKVKPAPAGEQPDPRQVTLNKQALLHDLEPYGVTNDRLDEVSNYYRYARSRGEMWRNKPASAYATVENGVVTSVTVTNPGSGYSSIPKISVPGIRGNASLTASLLFCTDLSKNGSIEKITINP